MVDIRGIKKIDGGRCPPYETLQSGSEQEFAPTIGTCGSGFRLAFALKLPSLLKSGAVALWGLRNHLDRDSAAQYNMRMCLQACRVSVVFQD